MSAVKGKDRVLGNLASRIAWVLMGKHKPTYDPAVDAGDYVVVSNALGVRLTGKKSTDKTYFHHTGFIGGLKEVPITRMRERRPEEGAAARLGFGSHQIIRRAVSGMLPKNKFRDHRLERLKIYPTAAPEGVMGNVLQTWRDAPPPAGHAAPASPAATQAKA